MPGSSWPRNPPPRNLGDGSVFDGHTDPENVLQRDGRPRPRLRTFRTLATSSLTTTLRGEIITVGANWGAVVGWWSYTQPELLNRSSRAESSAEREDGGAALIELAFALPLVIMLIVGMVSAGIAYNRQLSLTHAAREGGRYAATLPVTNFATMGDWLTEVVDQTVTDATGALVPGAPGRYVCVAYVHPDGVVASDQTARLILDSGGFGSVQIGQQCLSDGRPDSERRVQVVTARDTDFNAVFFSTTVNLDSEAVNRFEAGLGF